MLLRHTLHAWSVHGICRGRVSKSGRHTDACLRNFFHNLHKILAECKTVKLPLLTWFYCYTLFLCFMAFPAHFHAKNCPWTFCLIRTCTEGSLDLHVTFRCTQFTTKILHGFSMKGPSPCEPFGEPSAVPSCEEKGSSEISCEPSDKNYFHVKVYVKLHMNLLFT